MSMTVSVRVQNRNSTQTTGQRNHELRLGHIPAYVQPYGYAFRPNSIIIEPKKAREMKERCQDLRSQRDTQRAMKSTAAVSTSGIITFGKEAQSVINRLDVEAQDDLYHRAAKAVADRLNTDLTGLVAHRDEASPHAHFQMTAYNRDGMPLSKVITPTVAKELQDIVGQAYNECGITRGKPKAQRQAEGESMSKWVHRSVSELHSDLPQELAAAREATRQAQEKMETAERRVRETRQKIEAGEGDLEKLQKRLQTYENRLAKAQEALDGIAPEPERIERVIERTKRMGGLIPDKVTTETVEAYTPAQIETLKLRLSDQTGQRIQQAEDKLKEVSQRESKLNERELSLDRREKQLEPFEKASLEKQRERERQREKMEKATPNLIWNQHTPTMTTRKDEAEDEAEDNGPVME